MAWNIPSINLTDEFIEWLLTNKTGQNIDTSIWDVVKWLCSLKLI